MWKNKNICWSATCEAFLRLLWTRVEVTSSDKTDLLKPLVSNAPHWFKDWKQLRAAVADMLTHLIHGDKKALVNLILLPLVLLLPHDRPTKFSPQTHWIKWRMSSLHGPRNHFRRITASHLKCPFQSLAFRSQPWFWERKLPMINLSDLFEADSEQLSRKGCSRDI